VLNRHQGTSSTDSGRESGSHDSTRELTILNAISEALNSSADVRQALERTLGLVADLLGLRVRQESTSRFGEGDLAGRAGAG